MSPEAAERGYIVHMPTSGSGSAPALLPVSIPMRLLFPMVQNTCHTNTTHVVLIKTCMFPPPQISHLQRVLEAVVAVPALWEVMLLFSAFI